jgi:hypothetical protein
MLVGVTHIVDAVCEWEPGNIPIIYCSHSSCPHSKGNSSTTNFLTDNAANIPLKYFTRKAPHQFLLADWDTPTQEYTADISAIKGMENVTSPSDVFKRDDKISLTIATTGSGKSTELIRCASDDLKKGEKVIYLCPSKAEMVQVEKNFLKNGIELTDILRLESGKEYTESPLIISHYHYLLHKGHTNALYKLVTETTNKAQQYNLYMDEIDSFFSIAFTQIPLSNRYFTYPNRDHETLINKCVSNTACRFQCDRCRKEDRVYFDYQHNPNTFEWRTYLTDHAKTEKGVFFKLMDIPILNNITSTEVIKTTTHHNLKVSRLTPWSPEQRFEKLGEKESTYSQIVNTAYNNHVDFFEDIIAHAGYGYRITTGEDKRDANIKLYKHFMALFAATPTLHFTLKGKERVPLYPQTEEFKSAQITFANQEMNKLKPYPHHLCGVETVSLLDCKGFKTIVNNAKRVRMATATLSTGQMNFFKTIYTDIPIYNINTATWKPVEELLIIATPNDFSEGNYLLPITGFADSHVKIVGDTRINKTLVITENKSEIDNIQNEQIGCSFAYYTHNNLCAPQEHYTHGKWNTLLSYKRSSVCRGINLGEFSIEIIDYDAPKGMHYYDYGTNTTLEIAREVEHMELLAQALGRIMRKPLINNELNDNAPRKLMIIHNCSLSPEKTQKVDISPKILALVASKLQPLTATEIKTLHITGGYSIEDDIKRVLKVGDEWMKTGTVVPPGDPITNINPDILRKKYTKLPILVQNLMTREEHDAWRTKDKYNTKLEEIIEDKNNMSIGELRRKHHWSRLKETIPADILREFVEIFEEKEKMKK